MALISYGQFFYLILSHVAFDYNKMSRNYKMMSFDYIVCECEKRYNLK